MIKNILFDMGNVLIRFEPKRYVKNAGLSESDQQLLLRELYGSIDWVRLDRGTLTEAEVIDRCVSRASPRRCRKARRPLGPAGAARRGYEGAHGRAL